MEENKTEEKTTIINDATPQYCFCNEHPILKSIICGVLIFLGAYCAFYTIADWHFKRMIHFTMMPPSAKMIDKMIQKDMHQMDKRFKNQNNFILGQKSIIHLEQNKDDYKIKIDLRAFDNNDKNVQVTTNGNILTIAGRTIKKSKNDEQISEFQQNYMFGENVKLGNLTKDIEGNYYIITIPIENEE